jgi:hypothetical protein
VPWQNADMQHVWIGDQDVWLTISDFWSKVLCRTVVSSNLNTGSAEFDLSDKLLERSVSNMGGRFLTEAIDCTQLVLDKCIQWGKV